MDKKMQVLLVEDSAPDARLLGEVFSKDEQGSFELSHLTRVRDAEIRLAQGGIDIVLLDMKLAGGHGLENLRRIRAAAPGVVIIALTGFEQEAAEALKEGAQDYLLKGHVENRALPQVLRHAIERQRTQAEAEAGLKHEVQQRDDFLSYVAHELRSPLTSICSFCSIIADGLAGQTTPQQDDYLQIILRNAVQLRAMIEDLLEATHAQTGKLTVELQSVSVNDAAAYAVDTLKGAAQQKGIALSFLPSAWLPPVYADAMRLRQILTILVDNAVKFTGAGGTVTIRASEYEKDGSMVLFEISDTGCGIKPEETPRIFERMYQIKDAGTAGRKGLGLGLHIAKDLVVRQGGKIWVTSVPGKGSLFSFLLPTSSQPSRLPGLSREAKKRGKPFAERTAVEVG